MSGHPNPFRDSKEVIPMDDKGLLEPSFAEAIAAIEQSLELPPPRRTHWACSLRQIAKALGRPPESFAARWGRYSPQGQPASSHGFPVDAFGRSCAHFRGALAFRRSAAAVARTFIP